MFLKRHQYLLQKLSFFILFFFSLGLMVYLIYQADIPQAGGPIFSVSYIMGLSGLLAMVIMTWQVLLGIRPMSSFWVKDFFWVNGWHKRLGMATLSLIIIHPIMVINQYMVGWLYPIQFSVASEFEVWVSFGRVAIILLLSILMTSILSRKILAFRKWHRIHLLTYPMMLAVWIHGRNLGTTMYASPAVRTYWIVLGGILVCAMTSRLLMQFGVLKMKAKVLSHTKITSDVFELTLQLPRKIQYTSGQFIYLQAKRGGESHPFTILTYDEQTKVLKVAYRAVGSFTKNLSAKENIGYVFVDGPYGIFTAFAQQHTKNVCLAGGIGITAFYHLLTKEQSLSNTHLIYLNKTHADTPYLSELEHLLGKDMSCIFSQTDAQPLKQNSTGMKEYNGARLKNEILQEFIQHNPLDTHYYICGSKRMIVGVEKLLLQLGVRKKHIHIEVFGM